MYITLHYIIYITLHYITILLHPRPSALAPRQSVPPLRRPHVTLHYITLPYITLHYITLHYITLRSVFMILKSPNFELSVSNPKNKYVAYLPVLSQLSNCQGLGRKNKHEILKTDRTLLLLLLLL